MSVPGKVLSSDTQRTVVTSPSRRYFTDKQKPPDIEPEQNVIAAPDIVGQDQFKSNKETNQKDQTPSQPNTVANFTKELDNASMKENLTNSNTQLESDTKSIGERIKEKGMEIGMKLKNKTLEVGEKMKNKTLEQIAVISGSGLKKHPQLMYIPLKWNLTISFEDIGEVMKETQFLNKVDPLKLTGPILVSSHNRTANFTYKMPLKYGYCDCYERYCSCCSQITSKRLHLNTTACSNFTFLSKTHVSIDAQSNY